MAGSTAGRLPHHDGMLGSPPTSTAPTLQLDLFVAFASVILPSIWHMINAGRLPHQGGFGPRGTLKFHLRLRHGPHADTGRVCSCQLCSQHTEILGCQRQAYRRSLSAPGWSRFMGNPNISTSKWHSTHAETGRVCGLRLCSPANGI